MTNASNILTGSLESEAEPSSSGSLERQEMMAVEMKSGVFSLIW